MPSGRTRQFDADEALDRAMKVFWSRGFEGATLPELTAAMGINRPSLYAAFGNKEQLFRKVLERYLSGPMAFFREALEQPTAKAVAEKLLRGAVDATTDASRPPGCMVVHGALACGEQAEPIRRELAERRDLGLSAIRERFTKAVAEGDLPRGTDCSALARYIATIMNGLAVQARAGAPTQELRKVIEIALRAWPE